MRPARVRRQGATSRFASSRATRRIREAAAATAPRDPRRINQVTDPERILYPLRRAGRRGEGKWERVTWDEALDDLAGRIRRALVEGRRNEIIYHVGRPGHELIYNQRILHAWGIDGHNSHTNVCSAGARTGYAFWHGVDRPSPDHANARFILLLSSHLEAGHYFNPHAQRIIEAKQRGARGLRDRYAALQHRDQGRLLAFDLAGQRGGGAAGDVPRDSARGAVRSRVRAPMGQLGRVSARGASATRPQTFDTFHAKCLAKSMPNTRPSSPSASRARRPRSSSKSRARSDAPVRRSRPTSGATRRRAISADGRWRARWSCWSVLVGAVDDARRHGAQLGQQVHAGAAD